MTKWKDVPLRTQGESWPGLVTRTGRLMRRMGEMADCKNVTINRDDTLEKRLGFVRGLDERFSGVVCGLFAYTSNCGQEFLLVADQTGFAIRHPFTLPTFEVADCYPFDAFYQADGSPLNAMKWRNTARYKQQGGSMVLSATAAVVDENNLQANLNASARWFKDACSASYQTQTTYSFDPASATKQRIVQVIKGNEDLTNLGAIFVTLDYKPNTTYLAQLYHRDSAGVITLIGSHQLSETDAKTGSLQVQYSVATKQAGFTVQPENGTASTFTANAFNAVQDADLGLVSGLGIEQTSAGAQPSSASFYVAVIDGGSI